MKLKFDSSQEFQLQAVSAITDLFEGQPLNQSDFALEITALDEFGNKSYLRTETGIGNQLVVSPEAVYDNLLVIQEKNGLDITGRDEFYKNGLNFTVEMETGTGKTYVYLRTIFELSRKYGFKKFIVVVPSVAIREGVLKNIEITSEHFSTLYNNMEYEYFVYDGKKPNRLRQFASSSQLQIMIINIDSFRKDFSNAGEDKKSNIIFKPNEPLGRKPIEFIQGTNPFVIIDEPQKVDSEKSQEAIKALNPLCIFRYSATHIFLYNQVYKLDPVKAYQMRLVKQIIVASVTGGDSQNGAYIKLLETDNKKGKKIIRAKIQITEQGKSGVKEKDIWVKQKDDLYELSKWRTEYQNGYKVIDIGTESGYEYIDFSSGIRLMLGQARGGMQEDEDLSEAQIRATIKKHLDKELQLKGRGIKVLSLFFIDRVANYREYQDGIPVKGKYDDMFERHYKELIKMPQYAGLGLHPVEKIHDGYFSQDKKGVLKDTNGATQADDDTYAKIMKNKEQLLSLDEPLKFIFSHSTLREGWDNPNVFQICTLNETRSPIKKRQEIGRGLRLPVNQNGERVFDKNINRLTIIANESYDEFAKKLQSELEAECGVTFGKVPKMAFKDLLLFIDDKEIAFGRVHSENVWNELAANGFLDEKGFIQGSFTPDEDEFSLNLSGIYKENEQEIIAILEDYRIERHLIRDEDKKTVKLRKEVYLGDDFKELWKRIKSRTTYKVEYQTEDLIRSCVDDIRTMNKIEPAKINYQEAQLDIAGKGVTVKETRHNYNDMTYKGGLPDILAYLQKQTELTRHTLTEILKGSGRLAEFAVNPQKFMDEVAAKINMKKRDLMVNGIKYEKLTIGETEWSMQLFDPEFSAYLNQCIKVRKSIYDNIVYESGVERRFAEGLEKRADIKLFVKLPYWFTVETPVGAYNPDWAIVKEEDETVYLVRETKGTKTIENLRSSEKDKVKCGQKHFDELKVDFKVVESAEEV